MKRFLTALMLAGGSLSLVQAQETHARCGTSEESLHRLEERLLSHRKLNPNWLEKSGNTRYVPITVHLVAGSNGLGRVSAIEAVETLCVVNEFYDSIGSDIQFWIRRFNYIDDDQAFLQPLSSSGYLECILNKVNDSGNLYLIGNIPEDPPGDITGYYDTQSDWVVIQKNVVHPEKWETMGHEMGHFLSLLHTFNGWECGSFLAPGNAPPMSSCGVLPTERADGSNCYESGDYFCDTAPDYGFSSGVCSFNQTVLDPSGIPITVNKENLLSYFFNCPVRTFSEEQMAAMHLDLDSPERDYLELSPLPSGLSPAAAAAPTLLTPEPMGYAGYLDGNGNTDVLFDWADVPGATMYAIDIARNSTFDFDSYTRVIEGGASQVNITDYPFQYDKKYYWRVKAFNEQYLCTETAETQYFTTDNSVGSVVLSNSLSDWEIFPNPTTFGQNIVIRNASDDIRDARIEVLNMLGQVVSRTDAQFRPASQTLDIPTVGLPTGQYIVSINSGGRISQHKMLVS